MSLAVDNRNSNKKVSNKNNSSETTKYPAESYASKDFLQSYQLKANSSKKQTQLAVLQKKANNTGLPENVKNNTEHVFTETVGRVLKSRRFNLFCSPLKNKQQRIPKRKHTCIEN